MMKYVFISLLVGFIAAFLRLAAVTEVAFQMAGILFVLEVALHLAAKYTDQTS